MEENFHEKDKISSTWLSCFACSWGGTVGCGSKKTDTDASSAASSVVSTETAAETTETEEVKEEPMTITVGMMTNSAITDWDDNLLTKAIEEKFNVELEFMMLPSNNGDWTTKVSLMATAEADNMPDMLVGNGVVSASQQLELGVDGSGTLQPIEDYLADPEKTPGWNSISEELRELYLSISMTQADGHVYGLANANFTPASTNPERMWINQDWLDAVGKETPTTTEELKEVLLAFRDEDPNGNGVQDEIGLYGRRYGMGSDIVACLMGSFVSWNNGKQNGGLAVDQETGTKVVAPWVSDGWKKGLEYMNDLYEEGVFAAGAFTDDDTIYKQTLNLDPPIVGVTDMQNPATMTEEQIRAQYDFMLPVEGPDGLSYYPTRSTSGYAAVVFTCTGEKLDRCVAIADSLYDFSTPESIGWIGQGYGEYGVDWTDDPEVCAKANSLYLEAGVIDSIERVRLNAKPTQSNWNWAQQGANVSPDGISWSTTATMYNGEIYSIEAAGDEWQLDFLASLEDDKYVPKTLPVLNWTTEESDSLGDSRSNILSYVNNFLAECVTGVQDVNKNWDGYVKEIESLGLQNWLDMAQTIYDRQRGAN